MKWTEEWQPMGIGNPKIPKYAEGVLLKILPLAQDNYSKNVQIEQIKQMVEDFLTYNHPDESQPETIEPDKGKFPTEEEMKSAWFNWRHKLQEEPPSSTCWLACFQWLKTYKPASSPEKREEGEAWEKEVKSAEEFLYARHGDFETLTPFQIISIMEDYHAQFKAPDNMVENHHVKHTQVTEEEIRSAARGGTIARTYSQQSHFIQGVQWLQSHPTTQPQASKDRSKEDFLRKHEIGRSLPFDYWEHIKNAMQEYADQEISKMVLGTDKFINALTKANASFAEENKQLQSQLTQQQSLNSRLVEAANNLIQWGKQYPHIKQTLTEIIENTKSALSSIPSTINQDKEE